MTKALDASDVDTPRGVSAKAEVKRLRQILLVSIIIIIILFSSLLFSSIIIRNEDNKHLHC